MKQNVMRMKIEMDGYRRVAARFFRHKIFRNQRFNNQYFINEGLS